MQGAAAQEYVDISSRRNTADAAPGRNPEGPGAAGERKGPSPFLGPDYVVASS
jgi:hypothetical protein